MKRPLLLCLLSAGLLLAAAEVKAELSVGDPAPKLQTGAWIQGDPVSAFDSNHVYIVEFWAAWCGPCRATIPHLNELWQKFKGSNVVVIGQDVWDSDAAVAPFVKSMGDKMTYRVALDDKTQDADGYMAEHWWKRGVEHHGIPCAFVINQAGRIAWIGHPMGLNEKLLSDIISGRYDLPQAAAEYKQQLALGQKYNEINDQLLKAVKARQWDAAAAALDELLKLAPKAQNNYANVRLQILLGQKKYDLAYEFAGNYGDLHPTDFAQLNALAWVIATQEGVEPRNLDLAEKLVNRAIATNPGNNSEILDTLARIQFMSGQTDEAIATEQNAVTGALDADKTRLIEALKDYRQGKLPDPNN